MSQTIQYKVRVNGRGNAWPIPLGESHAFYDISNYEDLANASFSIIKSSNGKTEWEILIDAGHGIVQYLLQHSNRIPEAIFLTHPHIDHTLGIDWIIQSHFRKNKTKYPVYTTAFCWEIVKQSFPHLIDMVDFQELIYGEELTLFNELKIKAFPSYHGPYAYGASMLFLQLHSKKVLFTGDILLPMLRNADMQEISNLDLLVADANNRFPYPKSNHWSVCSSVEFEFDRHFYLEWFETVSGSKMIIPHIQKTSSKLIQDYLNDWLIDFNKKNLTGSIFSFAQIIKPKEIWLVHYSGKEDDKYHKQAILTDKELTKWCNNAKGNKLQLSDFKAIKIGDIYSF